MPAVVLLNSDATVSVPLQKNYRFPPDELMMFEEHRKWVCALSCANIFRAVRWI